MASQNIIYFNKESGCFVEFEIEASFALECLNVSMNAKDAAIAFIDALMPQILSFGDTLEFPKTLLCALQNGDEEEIDIFLLASYDTSIRENLESCLFVRVPQIKHYNYLDRKTYAHHYAEAIGKKEMILCKKKENNGLLLASVSFNEIENNFISM